MAMKPQLRTLLSSSHLLPTGIVTVIFVQSQIGQFCVDWFHRSIKWLLRLSKIPELTKVPSFSKEAEAYLQAIIDGFNVEAALEVKKIEKVTNHDVKAVEYFLKQKCESHPEFAKDINNLSHRLMLRESLSSVILPSMDELIKGGFLDVTVERQAARIRSMYLKTILRQDIGFFNVETNTGEVVGRMSGDTVLIQDAMGEKVGKFIQLVSTFVGGFALAFVKGWLRSSSRIIYYVQKEFHEVVVHKTVFYEIFERNTNIIPDVVGQIRMFQGNDLRGQQRRSELNKNEVRRRLHLTTKTIENMQCNETEAFSARSADKDSSSFKENKFLKNYGCIRACAPTQHTL
ncbi:hypothetical protein YC2023_045627 [Brassica napus]